MEKLAEGKPYEDDTNSSGKKHYVAVFSWKHTEWIQRYTTELTTFWNTPKQGREDKNNEIILGK